MHCTCACLVAASIRKLWLLQARSGDYLSKVAWLAGIPLDAFMLDNTGQVKDLDASLQGVLLLLCNPKQGEVLSCKLNV